MKQEPLHLIVARVNRMPIQAQVDELISLVAAEKYRSVRRNELQSLLDGKRQKLLRKLLGRKPRVHHVHGALA